MLTNLPDFPNLQILSCKNCTALTTLPNLPNLQDLYCDNCTSLITLPNFPNLHILNCSGLPELQELNCSGLPKLQELNCSHCTALINLLGTCRIRCRGCIWLKQAYSINDTKENIFQYIWRLNLLRRIRRFYRRKLWHRKIDESLAQIEYDPQRGTRVQEQYE